MIVLGIDPGLGGAIAFYFPDHPELVAVEDVPVADGEIDAAIPSQLVTPTRWKKHFRLSAEKEEARALALRMWPARSKLFERKKDHGRAEAAPLARYGAETRMGRAMNHEPHGRGMKEDQPHD